MNNIVLEEKNIENDIEKIVVEDENKGDETTPKKNMRDCIYGKIDVSLETMDKVIFGLLLALVAAIIFGVII